MNSHGQGSTLSSFEQDEIIEINTDISISFLMITFLQVKKNVKLTNYCPMYLLDARSLDR